MSQCHSYIDAEGWIHVCEWDESLKKWIELSCYKGGMLCEN